MSELEDVARGMVEVMEATSRETRDLPNIELVIHVFKSQGLIDDAIYHLVYNLLLLQVKKGDSSAFWRGNFQFLVLGDPRPRSNDLENEFFSRGRS